MRMILQYDTSQKANAVPVETLNAGDKFRLYLDAYALGDIRTVIKKNANAVCFESATTNAGYNYREPNGTMVVKS